jgi:hypothetical protein
MKRDDKTWKIIGIGIFIVIVVVSFSDFATYEYEVDLTPYAIYILLGAIWIGSAVYIILYLKSRRKI